MLSWQSSELGAEPEMHRAKKSRIVIQIKKGKAGKKIQVNNPTSFFPAWYEGLNANELKLSDT